MHIKYDEDDLSVYAKTIFTYPKEPSQCRIAVAWVIKNRALAKRGYFGGSEIKNVCLHPYQFGCWNGRRPEEMKLRGKDLKECNIIQRWLPQVLSGEIKDPTKGALYCLVDHAMQPAWTFNLQRDISVGGYQFYSEHTCEPLVRKRPSTDAIDDAHDAVKKRMSIGPLTFVKARQRLSAPVMRGAKKKRSQAEAEHVFLKPLVPKLSTSHVLVPAPPDTTPTFSSPPLQEIEKSEDGLLYQKL